MRKHYFQCVLVFIFFLTEIVSAQESKQYPCTADPQYQVLNFWIGTWDVYEGNQKVGQNRIESVLHSCAVIEHWRDMQGHEGKSFFYLDRVTKNWKQVWVTDQGPMKEKTLQKVGPDGSLLFQGQVLSRDGKIIYDRTTLSRQGENVRQVIEQSKDEGKTWIVGFDAIYKRH